MVPRPPPISTRLSSAACARAATGNPASSAQTVIARNVSLMTISLPRAAERHREADRCTDAGRDHKERQEIGVCADREMIAERLANAEADARKEHGLSVAAGSRRLRVVDGPSVDEPVLWYRFVEVRAIEAVAEIRVKARSCRAAQP